MFAKTLLSLAIAGTFSLSAVAAQVADDVTTQEGIDNLGLSGQSGAQSLEFASGKGFKPGSQSSGAYQITGNQDKLTITGDSTLISVNGTGQHVCFTEITDLTLRSSNGKAISVEGVQGGLVFGGTRNDSSYEESQAQLDKITIHSHCCPN